MAEEEFIRKAAKANYWETHYMGAEAFVEATMTAALRFRKPQNKAFFFDEIKMLIRQEQEEHLQSCPKAPGCDAYKGFDELLYFLQEEIDALPFASLQQDAFVAPTAPNTLTHLHPTVQKVASSLFATNHYPQAIQVACTALEKAIQQKGGQPASVTGTILISKVFPKDNPPVSLSDDQGEREGYGFLFRGLLQAIRNHYSHNLTEIPAARTLEWLGFISALFYKLDEAQSNSPLSIP
jgi:uncharacterized protein (TIGR02391 family)